MRFATRPSTRSLLASQSEGNRSLCLVRGRPSPPSCTRASRPILGRARKSALKEPNEHYSQSGNRTLLGPAFGTVVVRARSIQVPGVSIWNEPRRPGQTDKCETVRSKDAPPTSGDDSRAVVATLLRPPVARNGPG